MSALPFLVLVLVLAMLGALADDLDGFLTLCGLVMGANLLSALAWNRDR